MTQILHDIYQVAMHAGFSEAASKVSSEAIDKECLVWSQGS